MCLKLGYPVFTRKALKQAAGRSIVLKLLIGEDGRISRVVVDQGRLLASRGYGRFVPRLPFDDHGMLQ